MRRKKHPKFYREKTFLSVLIILVISSLNTLEPSCQRLMNPQSQCVNSYDGLLNKKEVLFEKVYVEEPVVEVSDSVTVIFDENLAVDIYEEYGSDYILTKDINTITDLYLSYPYVESDSKNYDDYSKDLLYRLTQREAGNQGLDGMRRVCDVVLNRVDDKRFPNNVESVIDAPGQFGNGTDGLEMIQISSTAIDAVNMEISVPRSERLDSESLYFNTQPITKKGLYQYKDHYFSQ